MTFKILWLHSLCSVSCLLLSSHFYFDTVGGELAIQFNPVSDEMLTSVYRTGNIAHLDKL